MIVGLEPSSLDEFNGCGGSSVMKEKKSISIEENNGLATDDPIGQMQRAMDEKRPSDAVRIFLTGQERSQIPRGRKLMEWLREMDRPVARQIITVFVHAPCPFCKNGLLTCEICDGHGLIDSERICETCLGLGLMLCSFCGGMGWSPILSVPKGIRIAVLLERARVARSRLNKLSRYSTPATKGTYTASDFKKLATLLLGFNRQVSVLEAVLIAGDNYRSYLENTAILLDGMPECSLAALRASQQMYGVIRLMAEGARRLSRQGAQNPKKQVYALRAAFYQSLVDQKIPAEQTGIGHPLMVRAIKHLGDKRRKS
jgi:hypothetical protein